MNNKQEIYDFSKVNSVIDSESSKSIKDKNETYSEQFISYYDQDELKNSEKCTYIFKNF